jgi:hypothetical protein
MMEMFSNGFRTNKSGSPVTMQSALPDKASSRYVSSFGSRQIIMVWRTGIILIKVCTSAISSSLDSRVKCLSNLGLRNTRLNSSKVCIEAIIISAFLDFSQHLSAVLPLEMKALKSTLQSKITITYFLVSSSISFKIFSSTFGVRPFRSAWLRISSRISSMFLRLVTNCRRVSAITFFSEGDIRSIFSATGSLTSNVIVFILLCFDYQI